MVDVVIIKSTERIRNNWPLGIVEWLIVGSDGIVRGAKLKTGKSFIQRAVQQLYPLELSCDRTPPPTANLPPLNHDGPVFRPKRDAAVAANLRIQELARELARTPNILIHIACFTGEWEVCGDWGLLLGGGGAPCTFLGTPCFV